ncbi:MAG: 2-oxoacid:acceptor oxidoreductase subunit alpha [Candidatus Thermoplasmatota archaeon]|nr:2-oxoacid:acceptor oxidoreductase subunit alpha [Candidatus Thermoplasmatota archaeon]
MQFVQGDVAYAYGALLAGCNYFAGYPITPATETAEAMARYLPQIGGTCIQMEDEIASMGAIIGAAWTGAKPMTATSGPGFSLMMENIGYAVMTETPCVIVNVQRSGPSTGQPTESAQGDMMQARWGTHGDHEIIALAPSTVQECMDLTIRSFNLAERFRNPVILLTDGDVGHMRERLIIPERKEYEVEYRQPPPELGKDYVPFDAQPEDVPRVADFGQGYHTYVTGLTHDVTGLPSTDDADKHTALVTRLVDKIASKRNELALVEVDRQEGARVGIISYGITARPASGAVRLLREEGVAVNNMRLIGIWPFPIQQVIEFAEGLDHIIVPEMNLGQMVHPIREAVEGQCKVTLLPKIGGVMHNPHEVMKAVEAIIDKGGGA